MAEQEPNGNLGLNTSHIIPNTNNCELEGKNGRPEDCPNNPIKRPENHRPVLCENCPENPEIYIIAKTELSAVHIAAKQAKFAESQPKHS